MIKTTNYLDQRGFGEGESVSRGQGAQNQDIGMTKYGKYSWHGIIIGKMPEPCLGHRY